MAGSIQRRFRPGSLVPIRVDVRNELDDPDDPLVNPTIRIRGPKQNIVATVNTIRRAPGLYTGGWQSKRDSIPGNYVIEADVTGDDGLFVEAGRFELTDRWL